MGIELCRGLAAFLVLLTHYAVFISSGPNGLAFLWTGVDFFFVISGFVFAPLILGSGSGETGRNLDVSAYFIRRFFRIYPLYLVAVLAYYANLPVGNQEPGMLLRHLLFLHTTRSYEEAYSLNAAFWSLPVEVEFYLLVPLLALLKGSRRALAGIFIATLLFSLVARYLRGPEDIWRILSVHLPAILPEFLVGTLLYHCVQTGQTKGLRWQSRPALQALLGGVLLLGSCYLLKYGGLGLENSRALDAPFNFLCACGYALLMYPLLLIKGEDYSRPAIRVALTAGACSYGVYLFHNLMPQLLQKAGFAANGFGFFLLAAGLSILLAWILFRFYEGPLRKLGRRLGAKA